MMEIGHRNGHPLGIAGKATSSLEYQHSTALLVNRPPECNRAIDLVWRWGPLDGLGRRPMMGGEFAKISDRFLEVPSPVSRPGLGTIVIMDDTS